jgi:hypothetical protein
LVVGRNGSYVELKTRIDNENKTNNVCTLNISGPGGIAPATVSVEQVSNAVLATDSLWVAKLANESSYFNINTSGSWTVKILPVQGQPDTTWLRVEPAAGTGKALAKIVANTANLTGAERKVQVVVTVTRTGIPPRDWPLTVSQSPVLLSSSSYDVSLESVANATARVSIAANIDYSIDQTSLDWLTVSKSGTSLIFTAKSANSLQTERVATVALHNASISPYPTITIRQKPPELKVAPTPLPTYEPAGGKSAVTVTTTLPWTVSADKTWVTLSRNGGAGTGEVQVSVASNTTTEQRTATLSFVSGTVVVPVTVTQKGCSLALSPVDGVILTRDAGSSGNLVINSNVPWSITSTIPAWLTATPMSGPASLLPQTIQLRTTSANDALDNNSVYLDLSGNTGAGLIVKQCRVVQTGAGSNLAVSPATFTVDAGTGTRTFAVTSNVAWSAVPQVTWLQVSPASGPGNGNVTVTVTSANPGAARSGEIRLTGAGVAVQKVTVNQAGISDVTATLQSVVRVGPSNGSYSVVVKGTSSGSGITARGICYSTSNSDPRITDKTLPPIKGTTGSCSAIIPGLTTGYCYIRFYVKTGPDAAPVYIYSPALGSPAVAVKIQ